MSSDSLHPMASDALPTAPQSSGGGLLEIVGVTKRFGGLPAVNDLTFAVREGETLGVIGPNGAGKSTLIGLIGGGLAPTMGVIRFDGHDISRLAPHRRARLGIARTFQIAQPFIGLNVRENIIVGALFGRRNLTRAQATRVADEIIAQVGMERKATLTGGELTVADRKRLEVARALATSPRLLLLDEVMSGLNANEVAQAVDLIRSINRSGVTVIVVEHILRAIKGVSDRVLVIHHGAKIAEDLPDVVLSDPRVIEAYLGQRYAQQQQQAGAALTDEEEWKGGLA
ncbi:MAG TPA: ABC transporter ATP-binding protein [Ktedonobacterales bacterium]|nr:ABC transporter ATP-binding protein [Ktedonobacterales bacterium]